MVALTSFSPSVGWKQHLPAQTTGPGVEGVLRGHLGSCDPEVGGGQSSRRSLSLSSLPPLVGQALGQVHSCWDLGGPSLFRVSSHQLWGEPALCCRWSPPTPGSPVLAEVTPPSLPPLALESGVSPPDPGGLQRGEEESSGRSAVLWAEMGAGWVRTAELGKKHPRAVTVGLALTTPLSWQQSPQKSLQRTLSDESLCSGRREPSFANPAGLEPGLPSDVLFTSTCAFPSSTLPTRRQHQHPHPPGGPGPIPTTAGNSFPEKKCEPGSLEAGWGEG